MITANAKAVLKQIMVQHPLRLYGLPAKLVNGTDCYVSAPKSTSQFPASYFVNSVTLTNSPGFWVGTGTTPATENDYALENRITSGLSSISITYVQAAGQDTNGNPNTEYLISVRNTSSAAINIGEIGLVQMCIYGTTQSGISSNSGLFLIDRTVLDTPVTIAPGETKTIDYTITVL